MYKVQSQIEKCLGKKIWLKSGGYLVIEKTEALTVIDVNTGKYVGNSKLSETTYKTNIEAAVEISRQLKLRDIAGIIIVDFIDMNKKNYKEDIIKLLNKELSKDKRKFEVLGMTKLGLVEIARRREKDSLDKYYLRECNCCSGSSSVFSPNYILDKVEKEVIRVKEHTNYKNIIVEMNSENFEHIKMNFLDIIEKITEKYDIMISLKSNNLLSFGEINIINNTLLTNG